MPGWKGGRVTGVGLLPCRYWSEARLLCATLVWALGMSQDYLNLTTDVAENVRDDVVMDMILEYEEQLNLLQRRFIQQLKDFQ